MEGLHFHLAPLLREQRLNSSNSILSPLTRDLVNNDKDLNQLNSILPKTGKQGVQQLIAASYGAQEKLLIV